MKRYEYDPIEKSIMEKSIVPFAVFQYIDKRVVTLVVSDGVRQLLGLEDRQEIVRMFDNYLYRDVHPDDVERISALAAHFAEEGKEYNVTYRLNIQGEYHVLRAIGRMEYSWD